MSTVIVAGALANKPRNGGEAWVRLSWLLGLRRLGLQTWFFEQIEPQSCRDETGGAAPPERSLNRAWFEQITKRFGLAEHSALMRPDGGVIAGAPQETLREVAASAELLINISGNLGFQELLRLPKQRAYLDLDPGYTQFWHRSGALGETLSRHESLLTVGLSIAGGRAGLPIDGLTWRPVLPPVVLSEWPAMNDAIDPRLTTVASWRGGYGRAAHEGRLYGQKAHQFRRFVDLPQASGASFEAALDIDPADHKDVRLLEDGGWKLVDPRAVAGDPDAFRRFVQRSPAEFSPAQGVYVETGCGWFGDRTTRYLASGRPAVIQDTALPSRIPLGEGLLSFGTPEEALAQVEAVFDDYPRHARAARQIAEAHLDSDLVLGNLLEDLLR